MVLLLSALITVSICTWTSRDSAALTVPLFTGAEQITSVNGGGCLDAPLPQPTSGQWLVQQFPCNAGQNQFWSFVPVSQDASGRNIVEIHSQFNTGFCFDLPGGSLASNTPVQLFGCHHGPDQQWVLNPVDTQTVTIVPVGDTSMCLDVVNAVANAQAQIQIFSCKPSTDPTRTNQEWRPASLPQGLTGGIAHVNHDCNVNLAAIALLGARAVGVLNCSGELGCVANAVSTTAEVIMAAQGTSFLTCGPPSVFRSGSVTVSGGRPVPTLLLSTDGGSFTVQAAAGWLTQSDGDIGDNRNFGFYHQELTAAGGGVTDVSVSDKFKLPRGTACGFHHTRNTPFNSMAGPQSTCMGQDQALTGQCPNGWSLRSHFDMSSGDGRAACGNLQNRDHCAYFTWCEYQDPNQLCDNDPQCLANSRTGGFALGISSNVDPNGVEGGGAGNPPCPVGFSRVNFYDDGRSAGQGLSWCVPIADLPQGLTAGVAYISAFAPQPIVTGGKAMGAVTPFVNGDGFAVRNDGDIGISTNLGFYHQELVSGGTSDSSLSDKFKLLPGTTCGFHHTKNSPGLTCMGFDPAIPASPPGNCPAGWLTRSQFDMSSGDGHAACGNLQNQDHCAYFTWCEYQDPNGLCADGVNRSNCQKDAEFIGYGADIASNVEASGSPVARTTCPANNTPCPCGWTPSPNFDAGRSSGQGLAWCIPP
jgi:hypothetical protein